jgi:hypothetical protein
MTEQLPVPEDLPPGGIPFDVEHLSEATLRHLAQSAERFRQEAAAKRAAVQSEEWGDE